MKPRRELELVVVLVVSTVFMFSVAIMGLMAIQPVGFRTPTKENQTKSIDTLREIALMSFSSVASVLGARSYYKKQQPDSDEIVKDSEQTVE